VLPVPSTALWRWALRSQAPTDTGPLKNHDDLLRAR